MRTADRYVLRSFLAVFLGSLFSVCFLFTVISILDSLNYLMGKEGASLAAIVRYYLLQLPQTVYMGAPVAALLSIMITLGQMNQNNELLALRAAGLSLARISAPILAAGVAIGLGAFAIGDTLVPAGNSMFLSARQDLKGEKPDPTSRIWYVSESDSDTPAILRIEEVERKTGKLEGLTVFFTGRKLELKEQIVAESASFEAGRGWIATDVRERDFDAQGIPRERTHEQLALGLPDTADELLRVQRAPEEMRLSQLNDQIKRVRRYGLPDMSYRVERQTRFSIPMAVLILMLVGAPLSIRPVRSGGLALSILGAVIVGFAYFVVIALLVSLGKGGMIEPWAAAWSANIIFGMVGSVLFMKLWR